VPVKLVIGEIRVPGKFVTGEIRVPGKFVTGEIRVSSDRGEAKSAMRVRGILRGRRRSVFRPV
jgi:hypothetical protein